MSGWGDEIGLQDGGNGFSLEYFRSSGTWYLGWLAAPPKFLKTLDVAINIRSLVIRLQTYNNVALSFVL